MTGFGRAEADGLRHRIVVEARAVNSRFLDIQLRLPPGGWALEPAMRKQLQDRLRRGRIEIHVRWEALRPEDEPAVDLQTGKARAVHRALEAMRHELGLPGVVDLAMMASFRDLIGVREASLEEERDALEKALTQAIDALEEMRSAEGGAIRKDLEQRARWMRSQVEEIQSMSPRLLEHHLGRWRDRLEAMMAEPGLDPGRLEQEAAIWVDRLDVAEELVRLGSHIDQFLGLLNGGQEVGKRLEFLLQEMHREVNTLGSKSSDTQVSHRVVEMKAQLERMREQVQNVE